VVLSIRPNHRTLNDVLTFTIFLFVLFLITKPFSPYIGFLFAEKKSFPQYVQPQSNVPIPSGKRLIIPSIKMDEVVYEGEASSTVHKGVWFRPNSQPPNTGGNTVLAGHRFSYSPVIKQPFYFLDKVKIGDDIALVWDKKVSSYTVVSIDIVPPTATSIERNTHDDRLTLYTCTPLWTAQYRLVITAKMSNKNEK
jgi:LPXTG-site transpeptidase (sortase) family protein